MAGIYLHIPFCRKRCYYCDFFKSTDLSQKPRLLAGLKKELAIRVSEFSSEEINTIYFGGGTPSVLMIEELKDLLKTIYQYYQVVENAEITLEGNPDDLAKKILEMMKHPERWLSFGGAGRHWVIDKFNAGTQAIELKTIYDRILNV